MSTRFWIVYAALLGFIVGAGRYFRLASQNVAPGRAGRRDYPGFFSRRENFTDLGWQYRQRGVRASRIGLVILLILLLIELVVEWSGP
jgi:hypothetical protein